MLKNIVIKGAKEHNLKNVSLTIPKEKFVVITGLSGSGKSSLAFDTIYAEGQRRYVESLSTYARRFLSMMEKPDVDQIEGLSPAISIEQKATSHNPRSTVGTVTEIYDYLRLLFSRIGTPVCPDHNEELKAKTVSEICDEILQLKENSKIMIMAPVIRGKKGEHLAVYEDLRKSGYVRVKVNGVVYPIEEFPDLEKNKKHDISAVIDRLVIKSDDEIRSRISESIETSLILSDGLVEVENIDSKSLNLYSFNSLIIFFELKPFLSFLFKTISVLSEINFCMFLGIFFSVPSNIRIFKLASLLAFMANSTPVFSILFLAFLIPAVSVRITG